MRGQRMANLSRLHVADLHWGRGVVAEAVRERVLAQSHLRHNGTVGCPHHVGCQVGAAMYGG